MPFDEAEELVRRLMDVSSCHIQIDSAGQPAAVYVTLHAPRPAAQVIGEVRTVLAAEAGIEVAPEQVHVAALGPATGRHGEDAPADEVAVLEPLEQEGRLRLLAFNTMVSDERTLAEVEVGLGSTSAIGRAEAHGAGSAPELMAQACLDALEKLCSGRVALRLVAWQRSTLGAHEIVTVIVQETEGREERYQVGAVRVQGDLWRAAAYAALESMNRRFGRILAGPPRHYEIS